MSGSVIQAGWLTARWAQPGRGPVARLGGSPLSRGGSRAARPHRDGGQDDDRLLSFGALVALSVGSMAAGGIFTLPSNVAATTAAGPALIGWLITGVGMFCLSRVFHLLAIRRPDLDTGTYAYAKQLLGPLPGVLVAWGYWASAWLANLAYFILLFDVLSAVVPAFGNGQTRQAMLAASALLWAVHALILRGVHQASLVNTIATVAKLLPIGMFCVLAALGFRYHLFVLDFWGDASLGSTFTQVSRMMLVTVWVFIGIEGASVCSSRARRREDVGRATLVSFAFMLALLVLVNVLSFGAMRRAELAGLGNPSLGRVMEHLVGPVGGRIVMAGLAISLLGAVLAWQVLCAETIQAAGADGTLPAVLGRKNRNGSPAAAMWLTTCCMQVVLVFTGTLGGDAYLKMVQFATSMILVPYLCSAAFGVADCWRGDLPAQRREIAVCLLATVYAVWLLYAAGPRYLLLSMVLYLPGIGAHALNRRQRGATLFTRAEAALALLVAAGAGVAVLGLGRGWLQV